MADYAEEKVDGFDPCRPLEENSLEELGMMFGQITSDIESRLEEREKIRQAFLHKSQVHMDMFSEVQERFDSRTGLGRVEIRPKGMAL